MKVLYLVLKIGVFTPEVRRRQSTLGRSLLAAIVAGSSIMLSAVVSEGMEVDFPVDTQIA